MKNIKKDRILSIQLLISLIVSFVVLKHVFGVGQAFKQKKQMYQFF